MPGLWRQSCATHLLGERHRDHDCRFNPSKSREILLRLLLWAELWKPVEEPVSGRCRITHFYHHRDGECSSIMFDTIFDGNENKITSRAYLKTCGSWSVGGGRLHR